MDTFQEAGICKLRFQIHPIQKRTDIVQTCVAPIVDRRMISDSGGHREMRYVISTTISLGTITTQVEFTLADRDSMRFRMLLGRSAMAGMFLVNPYASYLIGKKPQALSKGRMK